MILLTEIVLTSHIALAKSNVAARKMHCVGLKINISGASGQQLCAESENPASNDWGKLG